MSEINLVYTHKKNNHEDESGVKRRAKKKKKKKKKQQQPKKQKTNILKTNVWSKRYYIVAASKITVLIWST